MIGTLTVTACYIALNAAYFYALPLEKVASSTRVAADAAEAVIGREVRTSTKWSSKGSIHLVWFDLKRKALLGGEGSKSRHYFDQNVRHFSRPARAFPPL